MNPPPPPPLGLHPPPPSQTFTGHTPWVRCVLYFIVQNLGAIAGALIMRVIVGWDTITAAGIGACPLGDLTPLAGMVRPPGERMVCSAPVRPHGGCAGVHQLSEFMYSPPSLNEHPLLPGKGDLFMGGDCLSRAFRLVELKTPATLSVQSQFVSVHPSRTAAAQHSAAGVTGLD